MKPSKLITVFVAALLLVALIFAFSPKKEAKNETSKAAQTTKALPKKIEVTDSTGKKMSVPTRPSHVVVFDNGSLDTIAALGESKSVVGAATKNLPSYLSQFKKIESAGGLKEPDLEKINALQPDIIIISGRQESFKDDLEKIAPVLYLATDNTKVWESTKSNIMTIASIYGKKDQATKKINQLDKNITRLKAKATKANLSTLTTLSNEGQLAAFGKASRYAIINDTFGFKNIDNTIKASTHGQQISFEYVLEKNPDLIFVIDRTKAISGVTSETSIANNELVKQTTAGKNKKVIDLDPSLWYLSGGGLQSTQLMIDGVEKAFSK
ncbi:siderophore ABC transporter substrate-binding protein [Leuconostoc carnosum]|uniref:siderophore ABC transporter substrate-binding protein n=1 Tax=Leuconostoc carnosum TaxID=1252 RepID=UPI00345C7043